MELYIRIVNGQIFEHPILGDNFRQAFPDVDTNNLPPTFARFERIEQPSIGIYEIYEGVTYEWIDGIVKDVHHVRSMTEQERQVKIETARSSFTPTEDGWVFDENMCCWIAPELTGSAPNVIG